MEYLDDILEQLLEHPCSNFWRFTRGITIGIPGRISGEIFERIPEDILEESLQIFF